MQPLNFCRQVRKALLPVIEFHHKRGSFEKNMWWMAHVVDCATKSQKFMLPTGGILFEDPQFRGIASVEVASLPFDLVALEYERGDMHHAIVGPRLKKSVMFLRQDEEKIYISCMHWFDTSTEWGFLPEVAFDRRRITALRDGNVGFNVYESAEFKDVGGSAGQFYCEWEIAASFINAIQCSNVHVERVREKKTRSVRAALGFDEYHVLTVGGERGEARGGTHESRSPREHLRRGHIRQLPSGKTVWVNSCVVNPGIGGRIDKDYRMAA